MKFEYVVGFLFFTHIFSISNAGGGRKKSKGKEKKEVRNINAEESSRRSEDTATAPNIGSYQQSDASWMRDIEEWNRQLQEYKDYIDTATAPNIDSNQQSIDSNQQSDASWYQQINYRFNLLNELQQVHEDMYAAAETGLNELQKGHTHHMQRLEEWNRQLQECKDYFSMAPASYMGSYQQSDAAWSQDDEELIRSFEQSVAITDKNFEEYKWDNELSASAFKSSSLYKASSSRNEETEDTHSDSEK